MEATREPSSPDFVVPEPGVTLRDFRQYVVYVGAFRLGVTPRDKLTILFGNLLLAAFPLNRIWAATHEAPLFGLPRAPYRARKGDLVFSCAEPIDASCFLDSYERGTWAELRKAAPGDFIDVGASVGVFAVTMADSLNGIGRVLAFEPHPANQGLLARTIRENRLTNIKVVNAAGWSERANLTLYEHRRGSSRMDHSVVYRVSKKAIPVPALTVDEVVESERLRNVTLALIDAEGAEYEVLKGMQSTLRRFRSMRVIFEALTPQSADLCCSFLAELGFSARKFTQLGEGGMFSAVVQPRD